MKAMKKIILLFIFMLSFTGCGAVNDDIVHREGNLIVTNYSDHEITDTTITHAGLPMAASPKAIKDTQICYFTIKPADNYDYTVSFVDPGGEAHSREFTDDFTGDVQILIAVRYADGVWTIEYDE